MEEKKGETPTAEELQASLDSAQEQLEKVNRESADRLKKIEAYEEDDDKTGSDDSQAEIASLKAALKKANNESAGRRKELDAYKKTDDERKQAEMTELEQANTALETAQAKVADAEGALNSERIKRAVDLVAMGMNFHSPSNAYALAERSEIAVDEDGKVTGVEDALKALAKQQPHLINTEKAPNLDGDKRPNSEGQSIDEDELRKRYGI